LASRDHFESGFTSDLISTMAVIYAKIAWYHGIEFDIQPPYVPSRWLPSAPAADPTTTPYAFPQGH